MDKALEVLGVAVVAQEPCLVSVRLSRWASCFAVYVCKRFHLAQQACNEKHTVGIFLVAGYLRLLKMGYGNVSQAVLFFFCVCVCISE